MCIQSCTLSTQCSVHPWWSTLQFPRRAPHMQRTVFLDIIQVDFCHCSDIINYICRASNRNDQQQFETRWKSAPIPTTFPGFCSQQRQIQVWQRPHVQILFIETIRLIVPLVLEDLTEGRSTRASTVHRTKECRGSTTSATYYFIWDTALQPPFSTANGPNIDWRGFNGVTKQTLHWWKSVLQGHKIFSPFASIPSIVLTNRSRSDHDFISCGPVRHTICTPKWRIRTNFQLTEFLLQISVNVCMD